MPLRGSLRILDRAAEVSLVELTLAVFFPLGTATGAVATGLTLRIRRMYLTALEDRAARLEIERDQRIRLTAAVERSRVAREMRDIVGLNLSVMVGRADGAAALAAHRNERSAEAEHPGRHRPPGHGRTTPRPGRAARGAEERAANSAQGP
ncbi:hypothetical protein [Streptomyces sp. NBC_00658]|uniref:hypothetical protein n=1 Tax=Streptomyces sp. NBC_00658 TaxID=2975800 RepID=UPI0032490D27